MEFRKCPGCQASVLDDEAQECPFCGASMSGKPSGAPQPAGASRPGSTPRPKQPDAGKKPPVTPPKASPVTKSTTRPTGRAASPGKGQEPPEDDDPFDISRAAASQAPAALPRPAKGRMIRVVCPMCETPGFISAKMQGRDVKCCNPDCMVPVFKAPRPESEEVEESTTRSSGLSPKALILTTILGVGLLVGLLYTFLFNGGSGAPTTVDTPPPVTGANGAEDPVAPAHDLITRDRGEKGPQRLPLAEIQQRSLQEISDLARSRDENRNRAYSRRLAAEAYAVSGDVTRAREQLQLLQNVGVQVPFYQVEPLMLIYWEQLRQGNSKAALETLASAQKAGERMPVAGHATLDAQVALSAGEAAANQLDAARSRLSQLDLEPTRARAAALVQMVFDLQNYDLDRVVRLSMIDLSADPLAVAVAVRLISNGQTDAAIRWALAAEDAAVQEDCLSALAFAAAHQAIVAGDTAPLQKLRSLLPQQSATGQSRIQAGIATAYLMQNDQANAETALQAAVQALEQVTPLPAIPSASMRQIYQSRGGPHAGRPDPAAMRSAALSVAQVAQLQNELGRPDEAWNTLLQAWKFTPSLGPPYADMAALETAITENPGATQERLARELGLDTRDRKERAFREYRRQLIDFVAAANARFELEQALLAEAIDWGLLVEVGQFIQDPGQVPGAETQPYLASPLVSTLKQHLEQASPTDELAALSTALEGMSVDRDNVTRLVLETDQHVAAGEYREAGARLAQIQGANDYVRDQRALQLACRLVREGKLQELIEFVHALQDDVLGEDCLRMAGALSVEHDSAPDLYNMYTQHGLNATEKIALLRGLVDGIAAQPQAAPTGTTPPAGPG